MLLCHVKYVGFNNKIAVSEYSRDASIPQSIESSSRPHSTFRLNLSNRLVRTSGGHHAKNIRHRTGFFAKHAGKSLSCHYLCRLMSKLCENVKQQ